jgi:hypothetical protein
VLIKASLYTLRCWRGHFSCRLAAMAYPVIRVLLGDQWLDAVPIARVLCIGYICFISAGFYLFTAGAACQRLWPRPWPESPASRPLLQVVWGVDGCIIRLGCLVWPLVVATVIHVLNLLYSLRADPVGAAHILS